MIDRVAALVQRIRSLETELEEEFERRRNEFSYRVEKSRVIFERDIRRQHKAFKQKLLSYIAGARPMVVLTAPVIYSVIIPFVLLDLFVTVYQAICFPVYGMKKVRRADYIAFDRQYLSYLNGLEKLNCLYCSYGNGLIAYTQEIAGQTEKHWGPIKHAKRMDGVHRHYQEFSEYGDAESYQKGKQVVAPKAKN